MMILTDGYLQRSSFWMPKQCQQGKIFTSVLLDVSKTIFTSVLLDVSKTVPARLKIQRIIKSQIQPKLQNSTSAHMKIQHLLISPSWMPSMAKPMRYPTLVPVECFSKSYGSMQTLPPLVRGLVPRLQLSSSTNSAASRTL